MSFNQPSELLKCSKAIIFSLVVTRSTCQTFQFFFICNCVKEIQDLAMFSYMNIATDTSDAAQQIFNVFMKWFGWLHQSSAWIDS